MRVGMAQDRGGRDRLVDQRGRADREDHHANDDGKPAHDQAQAVARRRRIPNPINTSPSISPPTGSHGNEGWVALAAGKGTA